MGKTNKATKSKEDEELLGNRIEYLKNDFNDFINKIVYTKGIDYYSQLTAQQFVKLKKLLSNINNIITLQLTQVFVDYLYEFGVIDASQRKAINEGVEKTKANTNGFDVYYTAKIRNAEGIIAEVKCNLPVTPDRFGAAQRNGLEKDIEGLLHGKNKAKIANTSGFYKFMVMLDDDERVSIAAKHFVKTMQNKNYSIDLVDTFETFDLQTDRVYVVLLKLK